MENAGGILDNTRGFTEVSWEFFHPNPQRTLTINHIY